MQSVLQFHQVSQSNLYIDLFFIQNPIHDEDRRGKGRKKE